MKVLLINGSPHKQGCTNRALEEVTDTLTECGIENEIMWIGKDAIGGCTACNSCKLLGRCVHNDIVNQTREKLKEIDGLVIGTPVYYGSAAGNLISFLDRLFYSEALVNYYRNLYLKPAFAIASARRAGTIEAVDQINKYFGISNMPIITSNYWNMVFGNKPEEVVRDEEGMSTMRSLARNMAYFLKCKEAGKLAGIKPPEKERFIQTNFIH